MDKNKMENAYFVVIPADVRYDNRLTPRARLLYGDIASLCATGKECFATNRYFARRYGVSVRSVRRWISALVACGYLTRRDSDREENRYHSTRRLHVEKEGRVLSAGGGHAVPEGEDESARQKRKTEEEKRKNPPIPPKGQTEGRLRTPRATRRQSRVTRIMEHDYDAALLNSSMIPLDDLPDSCSG